LSLDWHALFAPLPEGAEVKRQPAGMEGWESLTIELSAGPAGLRHVMVTLAKGQPVSAGDWVMFRSRSTTTGANAFRSDVASSSLSVVPNKNGPWMRRIVTYGGTCLS
jgi:hypothetical protein